VPARGRESSLRRSCSGVLAWAVRLGVSRGDGVPVPGGDQRPGLGDELERFRLGEPGGRGGGGEVGAGEHQAAEPVGLGDHARHRVPVGAALLVARPHDPQARRLPDEHPQRGTRDATGRRSRAFPPSSSSARCASVSPSASHPLSSCSITTAGCSAAIRLICRRIRASSPASIPPLSRFHETHFKTTIPP